MKSNGHPQGQALLVPTRDGAGYRPEPVPVVPSASAVAARGGSGQGSGSINWRAVIGAFKRRWFVSITLGLMLGAAGAAAAWFLVPAPYEAFSELRISAVKNKILFETQEARASFNIYKQTQMTMVKSPMVFTAALREEDVKQLPTIRDQPFPKEWLEEQLEVSSPGSEFIRISLTGEHPDDLATLVNAVTDAFVTEVVDKEQSDRKQRLDQLEKGLAEREELLKRKQNALRQLAEQSRVSNPEAANNRQEFRLEMLMQYRKELMEVYFKLMDAKIELATLPVVKADVLDGDDAPIEPELTPEPIEVTIPDVVIDTMVREHPDFQTAAQRVDELESYVARNQRRLSASHPRLIDSQHDLAAAEKELETVREQVRPEVIAKLKEEIVVRQEQFIASQAMRQTVQPQGPVVEPRDRRKELLTQIAMWEMKQKELTDQMNEIKIEEEDSGILSFELEQHDKGIKASESIIKSFRDEIDRLKVELDSPVGISLYRKAEVPTMRASKKRYMATGVAGAGLLAAVVAGFIWLEMLARRIHCVDEIAGDLSMRLVGTLPNMPRHATSGRAQHKAKNAFWHNVLAESVDSARTVLLRHAAVDHVNAIMVTSATSGEGKTTLACHLATSLARGGRSVLLIDGDLRRPSVHKVFDVPVGPGFCELLRKEASIDEVIQPSVPEGLSVLPAGRINQEVSRLLVGDRTGEVLELLRKDFDFIVMDSSPLLPVTDGLLLAQHLDGVLFSIRRDVSRQAKVVAARQRLSMLDVTVLGAVATGLDDESSSYGNRFNYSRSRRDYYYYQPISS